MKNILILLTFAYATYALAGMLQNEDFKTEAELISAGGAKSQLLNDTKLYLTASGKTLDDAIADGDLAGGGGSAGINFVTDASFEKEALTPDTNPSTLTSFQTYTTDDELYSEFNLKYFRSPWAGLSAADLYLRDTFNRSDMSGKQGLFSIWINNDAANLKLCLRTDDATFTNACDPAYELTLKSDGTWHKYEIPFLFGNASVQYEIYNESFTGNANILVDNVYIGTMPDGYIQEVGQAHSVGSLNYGTTNCAWSTTSATYADFAVDADCTAFNITGNVLAPDTKIPAIKIPNARTDGTYKINFNLLTYANGEVQCRYSLSSSSAFENQQEVYVRAEASSGVNDYNRAENQIYGDFKFTTTGDKTIRVIAKRVAGTGSCDVISTTSEISKLSVEFFPDASNTIVAQDTELVKVVARMNDSLSVVPLTRIDVVYKNELQDNFNAYNNTTGVFTSPKDTCYAIRAGLLYNIMTESSVIDMNICRGSTCSGVSEADRLTDRKRAATSNAQGTIATTNFCLAKNAQMIIGTFHSNGATVSTLNTAFNFSELTITEVPKEAKIIGKFEQIGTSDLVKVSVSASAVQALATGTSIVQLNNEAIDNFNAFNTSTYTFTSPKTTCYAMDGSVRFAVVGVGGDFWPLIYKGVSTVVTGTRNTELANAQGNVSTSTLCLNQGDEITLRAYVNQPRNTETGSFLTITELPDTESIVKNLLAESSQTKCQTKYLSGDIASTVDPDIASFNFTNLTVGKKYRVFGKLEVQSSSTQDTTMDIYFVNNSVNLSRFLMQENYVAGARKSFALPTFDFTAANTSLEFNVNTLTSLLYILSTSTSSYVRICQLSDTVVETAEW